MPNLCEADIQLRDNKGHDVHMVFQNAKVNHPIMFGRRLLRRGCEIRLKGRGGEFKLPDGHEVEITLKRVSCGVRWRSESPRKFSAGRACE